MKFYIGRTQAPNPKREHIYVAEENTPKQATKKVLEASGITVPMKHLELSSKRDDVWVLKPDATKTV